MKHQSISRWLSQLGLPQYCTALEQEYDGVEDLLHVSEYDLLELGVHSHLHRLHLLTSLLLIKERERRRGTNTINKPSLCSSGRHRLCSDR
ncbi:unnamed protein product [Knipowitschia caucasica]